MGATHNHPPLRSIAANPTALKQEISTISQADKQPTATHGSLNVGLNSPIELGEYATPLMPLRERDLKVLTELFRQEEIDAIEADILHNLLWRCPEPCWEDDPFEFLRDYL